MDIELLFSRNPFVKDQSTQFSFIQPAHKMSIPLTGDQPVHKLPIPVEFENQNVMIEAIANGVRRSKAYFANSLSVQVIEEYGQIRVAHLSGVRPIPVIYVKVYARMKDGRVVFYKDGYTDVRNRFDFASLNTNEIDEVERFSILVLSEELGAVIREADPPKR